MNSTDKLIEIFKQFPGIGPRQAKRFVYFLLTRPNGYTKDLAKLISEIKSTVSMCENCFRFFAKNGSPSNICSICQNKQRDSSLLMIVSHDVNFENIEKTGSFNGYYFILGGTVPILEKAPEQKIRQIIAMNYNPEGEHTLSYLKSILSNFIKENNISVSTLGRGLSTGTELEYSDGETIKNALKNRQ
jgi:recombination protein RecR